MKLLMIGSQSPEVHEASRIVMAKGARLQHVGDIDRAVETLLAGDSADLVLVDVMLDVARLIRTLLAHRIVAPVVAFGVGTDARSAVQAIQAGAREFLPLPPDRELIAAILETITYEHKELIAEDPATQQVLAMARQIAPSDANVLITGESGTGKEMVARYVHQHSRRHGSRMVSVNCAAIPENLLESELFGHEKGAFTGASARRIGKFEEADGGTLLLDEISEMDPRLQAKLLRAIQEREIDRVGGTRPIRIDIRLIATSNRDLAAEAAAGRFREDLLFRLNVVNLDLPPLRARPLDIPPLARMFAERYAVANHLPVRPLTPEALARLRGHGWKGNVRELENCIHRAVLLARGDRIDAEAILLQGEAATPPHQDPLAPGLVGQSVADVERRLILDTLDHTLGNRTQAATILGISIRTLRNKLRQYGAEGAVIPPPLAGGDLPLRRPA